MNEYLQELHERSEESPMGWRSYFDDPAEDMRREFVDKYSWAIPNDRAIEVLIDESPLLEVAAGSGYWAYLVEKWGGTVRATDASPWEDAWTEVEEADHTVVEDTTRTLFTCWPSYAEEWTGEMMELYDGDTVVYVGEGDGGCTGNERFHQVLREDYGFADEVVDIPQWRGLHDRLYVFRKT